MKPLPGSNLNNLCYKSCMINFLSNDHNRFLGKENLLYHYRFSTSPKATSLRNRVLYLYKNYQLNELQTIYSSFQQEDKNQENINNQNMNDPTGEPQTKRTRTFIPRKKILTKEMALQIISGQNVENMFKKVNLYNKYKKNLLQNRSFIIQVYDEEKVVAIMNDYDDEKFSKPEAAVNTENDENIQLIDQEIQEITGNAIEEEIPTMNSCDSNFDVTSGLWSFPCISSHKLRKQQDPNLVQNIQHRYILGALNLNNVENGCIKGPHLIPDIPTLVCPCGVGWTSNQQLNGVTTFSRVLTIYTKIAPVQCQV
ncbi:unnamed protein product [Mytilus coruscus]|uniref:Uncharacterized protein n=1 Tax=Mytilus coruscus TaxID=42192 RepID=A0A6J8F0K4_MYTCO|nr:unnamed protein product [Mytilus coruscus]